MMAHPLRSLLLTAAVLSAAFLVPELSAQSVPALKLERSYANARAKAKSDGRLLFVMFEANDCKHCKKFYDKVLNTAAFRNFAKDHLAMVIYNFDTLDNLPDSEQKAADQFVLNFDIEITPTMLVFGPDGKNIVKTKGYRGTSADKIVAQLESSLP